MKIWRLFFFFIWILYSSSCRAQVLNVANGAIKTTASSNGFHGIENKTEAASSDVAAKGPRTRSYEAVMKANEMLQSGYQYASPLIMNQYPGVTSSPLHYRLGQRNTNFLSSSLNSNLKDLSSTSPSSSLSPSSPSFPSVLQQPENKNRFPSSASISTPFNKMVQNSPGFNLSKAQALAILLLNSFYGNSNRLLEETNSNLISQPTVSRFPQQSSVSTYPVSNHIQESNQASLNAIKPQQSVASYQMFPELPSSDVNWPHAECQTANKQDHFGAVLNGVNDGVVDGEAKQYKDELGHFGGQMGQLGHVGGQFDQFVAQSILTKDQLGQFKGQSTQFNGELAQSTQLVGGQFGGGQVGGGQVGGQFDDQSGNILVDGQSKTVGGQLSGQSEQIGGQLNPQFGGYLRQFYGHSAGQLEQFEEHAQPFRGQPTQYEHQLGQLSGQSAQSMGNELLKLNDDAGKLNNQLSRSGGQSVQRYPVESTESRRSQTASDSVNQVVHSGEFRPPNSAAANTQNTTSSSSITASASMSASSSSTSPDYPADQKGSSHYKFVQSRPKALTLFDSKQQQQQQQLYYSTPSAAALDYLRMHLKSLDFQPTNYGRSHSALPTDAQPVFKQMSLSPSQSPSPSPTQSQLHSKLQSSDSAVFQPLAEIYDASVHRPHALYGVPPAGVREATPSPKHTSFLPSNGEFQSSYF